MPLPLETGLPEMVPTNLAEMPYGVALTVSPAAPLATGRRRPELRGRWSSPVAHSRRGSPTGSTAGGDVRNRSNAPVIQSEGAEGPLTDSFRGGIAHQMARRSPLPSSCQAQPHMR